MSGLLTLFLITNLVVMVMAGFTTWRISMTIKDLDDAIANLTTAVNDLAGRIPGPIDTTPQVEAVNALTEQVSALAPPQS